METPEPTGPLPENFGLTKERLAEFEERPNRITMYLAGIGALIVFVSVLREFVGSSSGISLTLGNAIGMAFLVFMALGGSLTAAFFVALPGGQLMSLVK